MYFKVAKILAFVVGVEAYLVMAGWVLHIDELTRILPSGVNMKFPTALIFFLSAGVLYFISEYIENNNKQLRALILFLSVSVFLTMFLLFVSAGLNIQTSIERLFLLQTDLTNSFGDGSPAIQTTINFILFGSAGIFAFFCNSGTHRKLKFFGYPILIIGLGTVIGYIFDLPVLFYHFGTNATPMAFNTALSFVFLGAGLVILAYAKHDTEIP